MIGSVATVSLTTAVITAAFVGYQQRRLGGEAERHQELLEKLSQLEGRLEALDPQR
jgi:hypothetical protein